MTETEIAKQIVDAAYRVHVALGPGLLESVYEAALAHELDKGGLHPLCQRSLPVDYDGVRLEADKRLGLLINFNTGKIKDGITRIVNGLEE